MGFGELREKNSRKKLAFLVGASGWISIPLMEIKDSEGNMKKEEGAFSQDAHFQGHDGHPDRCVH